MQTNMTEKLGTAQLEQTKCRSDLGIFATPEAVAQMVIQLLGPESSVITGTVITVDGGSTA